MKERLTVRFCMSYIYIWIMRIFFLTNFVFRKSVEMMIFCLILSLALTLFLEAFHYIMLDFIKYTKFVIGLIIVLSAVIVYLQYSPYNLTILIYIDIIMISDLLKAYQMHQSLSQFKQINE